MEGINNSNKQTHGPTALTKAVYGLHSRTVAVLLKHRTIIINATNKLRATPIAYATEFPEIVKLLLDAGATVTGTMQHWDPRDPTAEQKTNYALTMAVECNHKAAAKMLIARRPEAINYTNKLGITPLAAAARAQRKDLVEMLIKAGADVN
ncbi:ankyrin repeat domain-containing protein [Aspergillus mulundensis]|uniref:Uncharacterized protein n=1 Tax=Aspergillus mulundensis TaxID=1810919 RepID=A0A3D8Q7Q2_9EURO|nr:hypothetical protein DSM5745_11359 [Aspergillus mulundensis]RDW57841.1 hypothetical protein DSM5745_11359 [Aspergillus mulundensis]